MQYKFATTIPKYFSKHITLLKVELFFKFIKFTFLYKKEIKLALSQDKMYLS